MSSNPTAIDGVRGATPDDVLQREQTRSAETAAFLQEVDANKNVIREVKPDAVLRFSGTLPFDADTTQLQDGQTVTASRGDQNIRLNMEMAVGYSEFQQLARMRTSNNQIRLVSPSYSGPATFDQIKYDRLPDANGAVFPDSGSVEEARYVVQLQSKEQSDNDSIIDPFSDD